MFAVYLFFTLGIVGLALALRPWRAVDEGGPPWPWLMWWAVMPALWGADHYAHTPPILQPLSGACLLVLMAGWPLAMLGMVITGVITTLLTDVSWAQGLSRLMWLGLLPGSLAFGLGLAIRRWLPPQVFIFILGRGFLASVLAGAAAGWLGLWVEGTPPGSDAGDVMIGRWLSAWGDAFLTGMFAAIFVALRPEWLATYSDRLYLRPPPRTP